MTSPDINTLAGIAKLDERKRINLKSYLHPAHTQFRVYVQDGGKTITLEAVDQ